ncbi:MAG: hypothetical protein ACN6O7_12370, partial [Sphingobacterium sp.]
WESRSVPFFTRKPLLETVKGFFRLDTSVLPCTNYCISSALLVIAALSLSLLHDNFLVLKLKQAN